MQFPTSNFRRVLVLFFWERLSAPCFSQSISERFSTESHLFFLFGLVFLIFGISVVVRKKHPSGKDAGLKKLINEQIAEEDFFSILLDDQKGILFFSENTKLLSPALPNIDQANSLSTFFGPLSCKPFFNAISRGLEHVCSKNTPFYVLVNVPTNENSSVPFMVVVRIFKSSQSSKQFLVTIQKKYVFEKIRQSYKKALNKAEKGIKKLEDMDKLKSEFLAICSHELKTPLVSIKGYLDLMSTKKLGELTAKQEKALKVSLRNADNLNELISSMLNFARMEAGKLKFDLANQNLTRLVSEAIDSLAPMASTKGTTFEILISEETPLIRADESLLNRVLLNLLQNAIKFSPPNSKIIVKSEPLNGKTRLSIIDNGEGIAKDKIELIQTPFYQIDRSDTRPRGGLGLGLAIAQRILLGHGTQLFISSELGKGSKFSFDLLNAANE